MAKIRFKVGDKSLGVEIISIGNDMYNMICECENTFSRSFKMDVIPQQCRRCADNNRRGFVLQPQPLDTMSRDYTPDEEQMIKDFKDKQND